jgi:LacI family transcriptional regulator
MVTMKYIARLANTSIGTVDRALKNKPEINKETRQKIILIAESLGYTPNRHGKALAVTQQNIKLGFILDPTINPYIQELKKGVEQGKAELEDSGISTHLLIMNFYDENEQVQMLENLRAQGVSGIALTAINSPKVNEKIDTLVEQGIKVVTCNSDNSASRRSCFVGFKNELSGRVAAELLAKLNGKRGQFVVEIGFQYILAHMQRHKGFTDKIKESYPDISIVSVIETEENEAVALEKNLIVLTANPNINGIYIVGFGANGVSNAVKIKNMQEKVRIICHDRATIADEFINEGIVDAVICQNPVRYGYMAMKILSELVINNKEPKQQNYLTDLDIRLKENLTTNTQDWEI